MLKTIVGLATAALMTACSPSGYSLQARSIHTQPVQLRIQAEAKDGTVRTLESPQLAPGSNITLHTKAEHDEKVTLEAREAGDAASPPAVFKMLVGLSKVVVSANAQAGKEGEARVKIREDR